MLLGRYTCVLDACVLHPAFLRGSLLWFAHASLYRPVWSDAIFDEWERSLARRFDDAKDKLAGQRAVMEQAFPGASVAIPEDLLGTFVGPDPDDAHVVAAAVVSKADAIITTNLKDFPPALCDPLRIEVVHPDDFLVHVIDLHQERALAACRQHREVLKNPPFSAEDFIEKFRAAGLIQTHQRLSGLSGLL